MSSTRGRLNDSIHPINEFCQLEGQIQSRQSRPTSLPTNIENYRYRDPQSNRNEGTGNDNSFQTQRSQRTEYYRRRNSDRDVRGREGSHNYVDVSSTRNRKAKTIASIPIVSTNVTKGAVNNGELAKTYGRSRSHVDAEDSVSIDQTCNESGTSGSGKDVRAPTAFYNQSDNPGSRLARKRKHPQTFSPDITQVVPQKEARPSISHSRSGIKECIENEAADPLSEAETVVEVEGLRTKEPLPPLQFPSMVTTRKSLANQNRSSLAEDFGTERKVPSQINNDDRNYAEFNVPGMFRWFEKQILKTNSRSNILKRLADILKRKEVFIVLRHQLLTIRNNPYLMRKNSLDQLFFLLSRSLCAIAEGEMNAMLSEYQEVLGILTSP